MAQPAVKRRRDAVGSGLWQLLATYPGRLEFALRLASICGLTALVVEYYQIPDAALTVYVVLFVVKPDRAASVAASLAMIVLISLVVGLILVLAMHVIEQPLWRVATMAVLSFLLTFLGSASKLKPIAGTMALLTAYALDLLGNVPGGEPAARGILYIWLFIAIPAGISIAVSTVAAPSPKRLVGRALAQRLRGAAAWLHSPGPATLGGFQIGLHEGLGEIQAWLKLAALEKTSLARDIAALHRAACSTVMILSIVDFLTSETAPALPATLRTRLSNTLGGMARILDKGAYPTHIKLATDTDEAGLHTLSSDGLASLRNAFATFAEHPLPSSKVLQAGPKTGFFLPDAFTNKLHVHHALRTTAAAMICYVSYLLLDWPGIHTCLITCFIVSLGTAAETVEKQVLRFAGCAIGAACGTLAIIFLMPGITTIGALMGVVFIAALAAGWVAAGGPRIAYAGFQLGFAFFLCVMQGASPAFDMSIVRDRSIGIFIGDIVVAVMAAQCWPATIAGRIDPAITALLAQIAALTRARHPAQRAIMATETRTKLATLGEDLALTHFEARALRPSADWLARRQETLQLLSALQGPLLVGLDGVADFSDVAHRLEMLAGAQLSSPGAPPVRPASAIAAAIDVPLARLEALMAGRGDAIGVIHAAA